jgi:hypothetical protein
MQFRTVAVVSAAAVISAIALGTGGAQAAANQIWDSSNIKNGSLLSVDFSPEAKTALKGDRGATGPQGAPGTPGSPGHAGDDGLLGAFYATSVYNAGDTNAGAIVTVACNMDSQEFTAIAGGVQVLGLDAGADSRNTPVSSSFPGRMDWNTNTPKVGRLDGWIVQFGGNAGATSDKAPEKVKVWALCVPNTDIPVNQTFLQS